MLASSTARSGFAGQGPISSRIGKFIGTDPVRVVGISGYLFCHVAPAVPQKTCKYRLGIGGLSPVFAYPLLGVIVCAPWSIRRHRTCQAVRPGKIANRPTAGFPSGTRTRVFLISTSGRRASRANLPIRASTVTCKHCHLQAWSFASFVTRQPTCLLRIGHGQGSLDGDDQ